MRRSASLSAGPAQFYGKDSVRIITFGARTVEGVAQPFKLSKPLQAYLEHFYGAPSPLLSLIMVLPAKLLLRIIL
jgi:hypothetical protein